MNTLKHGLSIFVVVAIGMGILAFPAALHAQDTADEIAACQELVSTVVLNLDSACGSLERNSACYGNNRVDATFWEARDDLSFSAPADRIPLVDLQTIATAPLDVSADLWGIATLHAQVDLPDTLPGQAVTFMLMGDASLENRVTPEDAAVETITVPAVANTPVNLRSHPSTLSNVPRSLPAGASLALIGIAEDGAWFQVWDDTLGKLWVFAELVTLDDPAQLETLPIVQTDATRYGPMQAFYFTTGLGAPTCQEAPNALVVQNPTLADITLNINDLDVTIGSTVVFMMTTLPDDGAASGGLALLMILVEGHLSTNVNGVPVNLTGEGDTLALTVSADGLIDDETRIIVVDDPALVANVTQTAVYAVQNAQGTGVFAEEILPEGSAELIAEQALSFFEVPLPALPDPEEVLENLPDVEDITDMANEVIPDLLESVVQPGEWGGCGSCDSCGFYTNQCVLSPDGACVWNPGRCQAGPNQDPTGGGTLEGLEEFEDLNGIIDAGTSAIEGIDSGDVEDAVNDVVDDLPDLPELPSWP